MQEVRETVYEHLSGGETFTITAAERWSVAMLRRLKEKYPDQVEIVYENKDGSLLAHLPFEWMRIVPKRRDTMSDEQRAAQSERMKVQNHKWGTEKSGQIRTPAAETGNYISQPLGGEKAVQPVYIVEWSDHEGNQRQRAFDSREAAEVEAAALEKEFDHVAILWEEEV